MKIEFPNAKPLTPEEAAQLTKLKALIEKAVEDGVLTSEEIHQIQAAIAADHKVFPEELELVKTLIRDKVACGELDVAFFDRVF